MATVINLLPEDAFPCLIAVHILKIILSIFLMKENSVILIYFVIFSLILFLFNLVVPSYFFLIVHYYKITWCLDYLK